MMKKIFVLIIAAVSAVACFDGKNYDNYRLNANFEYGENYVQFRPDSTYYSGDAIAIPFNCLAFHYTVDEDKVFSGGFRMSCLKGLIRPSASEDESQDPEQETENGTQGDGNVPVERAEGEELEPDLTWRVHGAPKKNTYMVYCQSETDQLVDVEFMLPTYGTCTMQACMVNNTAKVAKEVADKFERGDKLTLKAVGYLDGKETGSAEIALADYTQNDKAGAPKDSIMSAWTGFDLSKLGSVDKVRFELESTASGVSEYFCLDEMVVDVSLEY